MGLKISILVTVSSEHFSEGAIRRAAFLAKRFEGELTLLYIIEEAVLRMIDRTAEYIMTTEEIERTEEELIEGIRGRAKEMLFERAALLAQREGAAISRWEIEQGEYGQVILDYCKRRRVDLIVMSFTRAALLRYAILDWDSPPIWVEKDGLKMKMKMGVERILALPSSLSPNRKLPGIALEFARRLGAELYMEYVLDPASGDDRALREGEEFLRRCERELRPKLPGLGLTCALLRGRLERVALTRARELQADLLILGEELEPPGGWPFRREIRQRVLAGSPCSLLFVK